MLNNKLEAGRQISKQLLPSEDAIDGSIIQNAKLIISIIEGRKKMGVAAEVWCPKDNRSGHSDRWEFC